MCLAALRPDIVYATWAYPDGLAAVGLASAHLAGVANELATVGSELVLVLDDYHLISNPVCHQTLVLFIDHLPANVHVVLSTRVDPPLLGRALAAVLRSETGLTTVASLRRDVQRQVDAMPGARGGA